MKKIVVILVFILGYSGYGQEWVNLGKTNSNQSPYLFNYYLLMDLNGYNGNVSAEFEVMVFADDNYLYHSRSSIFASRHSGTEQGRFDGVSMNYISGKPGMLEVLVDNNKIWIRAKQKWGDIRYRLIDGIGFGQWTIPETSQTSTPSYTTVSTQPFYYDFDTSKLNHYPSMLPNGNVGIGTPVPDAPLTVKGIIHTQEVKVDLLGSIAPDYVFKEDYDLKTLEEVESHIKEKGHLPNIPSAKQMEIEGIMLKEMNLKLLEKVEELTLYLIREHKKNVELEKKVMFLEMQLNSKN